ncbi:MAG: rRNA maturation RNase YbeY [Lachnospiraceae bacterium]|nr:rRNA maturation RNase YbeY [Lachnospiraceae bacterium]
MTVYFENEQDKEIPFDCEELVKTVIQAAVKAEQCPYEVSVSVIITDNESIKEANRDFRGLDRATDVLSFPAHQYDVPSDFTYLADDDFDMDTGELILGDIMISYERALEQAKEYGHSIRREIAFLTAHSVLHLCGYDHETDDERLIMEEKQEAVLQSLGITRDE